jgi:hypothetical protein
MSRDYDLVDLWLEHGERLPPDLACIALEMLFEQPERMEGCTLDAVSQRKAFMDTLVQVWKTRLPVEAEVQAVARLLDSPHKLPKDEKERNEERILRDVPLVYLVTQYTKGTRPTALFSQGFKLVNRVLMPYIVKCFPP